VKLQIHQLASCASRSLELRGSLGMSDQLLYKIMRLCLRLGLRDRGKNFFEFL
jgi:hypothetical protein